MSVNISFPLTPPEKMFAGARFLICTSQQNMPELVKNIYIPHFLLYKSTTINFIELKASFVIKKMISTCHLFSKHIARKS